MTQAASIPSAELSVIDGPIRVKREEHGMGGLKAGHRHREGQLFAVTSGLVVVETEAENWIVTSGRVGWIPPRMSHGARTHGQMTGWTAYLHPDRCASLPSAPGLFMLTDLMAAAIDRLASSSERFSASSGRLVDVVIDELLSTPPAPLRLPMPLSAPLRTCALAIIDSLEDDRPLAAWANDLGMSDRNLARRFRSETGMSVGQWRHLARLTRALEHLGEGMPVTEVAIAVGYSSVSAFISLFRRTFGTTPARYRSAGLPRS